MLWFLAIAVLWTLAISINATITGICFPVGRFVVDKKTCMAGFIEEIYNDSEWNPEILVRFNALQVPVIKRRSELRTFNYL